MNHSTWSAKILGVALSTVLGKLMMTFSPFPGFHSLITASHTSTAKSTSVPMKLSGEYSYRTSEFFKYFCEYCFAHRVPWTARSRTSSRLLWKTTLRCSSDVELYTWIKARLAPTRERH